MSTVKVLYVGDSEVVLNRYLVGADAIEHFAPHWAGDFVRWPHNATFWKQMVHWLARRT